MEKQEKNRIIILALVTVVLVIASSIYLIYGNDKIIVNDVNNFKDEKIIYERDLYMSEENRAIFSERLEDAENSLETSNDKALTYNKIGIIKKDLGDFLGAIDAFEKANTYNDSNFVVWLNIGNTYKEMRDYGNAEIAYRKSLKIDPANDNAYLALMDLYWYHSNLTHKQIMETFNVYLDMSNSYNVALKIGQYLEWEGYKDEAIALWEEYLSRRPDDVNIVDILERLKSEYK